MEAFLGLVAEKIVVALASEALDALGYVTKGQRLRLEVNEMMRRIRSEFEHIQTFISNVELHKYGEPWVKRVREIGESMEDIIDRYLYLRAEQSQAAARYYYIIRFDHCNIFGSNPWSDIGTCLKKIEWDLVHLKEMKERYDIETGEARSSATTEVASRRYTFNPPDEDTMRLFEKETGQLMEWLKKDQAKRVVIVVHGMGGIGKTTLVMNVYKNIEFYEHFSCKIWVPVSKNDTDDLLKRLVLAYRPWYADYMQDRDSLIRKVKYLLEKEKCLIVFDDVCMESGFMELIKIIPNDLPGNRGSRVVVTTRSQEIVEELKGVEELKSRTIELSPLSQHLAWELFCWKAFRNVGNDACPVGLKDTGEKIVQECGGLPLAIVAIARVMSLKRQNADEWKHVLNKLSWEVSNNPSLESVKHVLNLSFEDIPSYLRNCFLYCTILQADIERSKLIQLWVAESFIQDRGSQTKEEVAEEFFNELVDRSMLHVVERNRYGKVRKCKIYELVRDIALSTARKERFSIVWKESEPSQLGEDARRLSVHNCTSKQSILFKMDFSRIRSLFIFDYNPSTEKLFTKSFSSARYLRVIDMEKAEISKIPRALMGLFNLHYLGLRGTKVKRLPRSIGNLRNLQTLDVRYTNIEKLPKGVNQHKNLRHLLNKVSDETRRGTMHSQRFVRSPPGVCNLRNLLTLSMAVDKATVSGLRNLTALRILKVSNVKQSHLHYLSISLSQMPSLYKLSIIAADESVVLRKLDLALVFNKLHKLHLHGRLTEPVLPVPQSTELKLLLSKITRGSGGGTPPHSPPPRDVMQQMGVVDCEGYKLRGLCLSWCELKGNPLPMISSLRNLTMLKLNGTSDAVELLFEEQWFPELKELHLLNFKHLNRIIVEKEALNSLEVWAMVGLSKLMVRPIGIDSLTALIRLSVSECNPIFLYEIHKSVDQIQRIEHNYQVDGKWICEPLTRYSAATSTNPALPKPAPTLPSPPQPASSQLSSSQSAAPQPSPPHPARPAAGGS